MGETGDLLRMRVNLHRQRVSNSEHVPLPVSKHISSCGRGKNLLDKFSVLPLFKPPPNIHHPNFRKEKEIFFIELLKPKLNVTPHN